MYVQAGRSTHARGEKAEPRQPKALCTLHKENKRCLRLASLSLSLPLSMYLSFYLSACLCLCVGLSTFCLSVISCLCLWVCLLPLPLPFLSIARAHTHTPLVLMQKLKWTANRVHCVKTKKIVSRVAARTPSLITKSQSIAVQPLSSEQFVWTEPEKNRLLIDQQALLCFRIVILRF